MNTTCDSIIKGIRSTFMEAARLGLTPESILGELPDWDSMAAVNLQTFLQQHFRIDVPLEMLVEETTIGDIAAYVQQTVGSEMAPS